MQVYLVGGAVRDKLLGLDPKDKDYVVIGSSPEELLGQGFRKVGDGFPIYFHPDTKADYSLADDLTTDLERRDLTINAMAISPSGELIDPFGGQNDLKQKCLRHVSESFSDDPVRVFRVARFKATYPGFSIDPATLDLMRKVVQSQSFKLIATDRIFIEMKLALMSSKPSVFFEVLNSIDGLKTFFPEIETLKGVPQRAEYHPEGDVFTHTLLVLDSAADLTSDLIVRFSALVHDLGKGATAQDLLPKHHGHEEGGLPLVKQLGQRLKVPNDWMEGAAVVTKFHLKVHRLQEMKASTIVRLFYEMDAFRKPSLVEVLARSCEADDLGKLRTGYAQGRLLEEYFKVIRIVSSKDVPQNLSGISLGEAIQGERVRKLNDHIQSLL